jgi:hypothetical protein
MPAGSSRDERLDPITLPVLVATDTVTADHRSSIQELSHDSAASPTAMLRDRTALDLAADDYIGVAIRMLPPTQGTLAEIAIVLENKDPELSVTLYQNSDSSDVVAEWQSWGRALELPLLVADADGRLREPFERIGALRVTTPVRRRRCRSSIRGRRPSILLRRKRGRSLTGAAVHREREIIARH